jgi:hypothetical protein
VRSYASLALLLLYPSLCPTHGLAQIVPSSGDSTTPVLHISSDLVLVDVEAINAADDNAIDTLKRDDFQIFDNGQPVSIKTFDRGVATRPLALWFVAQCNMRGWEAQGSGFFAGQINRFQPALRTLENRDSVAVAHWCDDGQSHVDLQPTTNIEQAMASLEQVLEPEPDRPSHGRSGELALQKTLQLIVDATRSMPSEQVPVIVSLYGDYSAMPKAEANQFIGELLATSAIAFGLRDSRSPHYPSFLAMGEQGSIANYIAKQTGGEYFSVTPETYASGLREILQQLHARYELGFVPRTLNGKRHSLQIKLTHHAGIPSKSVRLRYRGAYVATSATSR